MLLPAIAKSKRERKRDWVRVVSIFSEIWCVNADRLFYSLFALVVCVSVHTDANTKHQWTLRHLIWMLMLIRYFISCVETAHEIVQSDHKKRVNWNENMPRSIMCIWCLCVQQFSVPDWWFLCRKKNLSNVFLFHSLNSPPWTTTAWCVSWKSEPRASTDWSSRVICPLCTVKGFVLPQNFTTSR